MFTGIIEETGRVKGWIRKQNSIRLEIQTCSVGKDLELGNSLAVNGCCLTIVQISGRRQARLISADILGETWRKTNFRRLAAGSLVNLERPLESRGKTGRALGIRSHRRRRQDHAMGQKRQRLAPRKSCLPNL